MLINNLASRVKVNVFLLFFTTFIVYCIYTTSHSLSVKSNNTIAKGQGQHILTPPPPPPPSQQQPIQKENVCKTNRVLRNVDPNHTNAHLSFWTHLPDSTIQAYKHRWQRFITNIKHTEVPAFTGDRGIVLVAGNKDTLARTLTTIRLLRNEYHCMLPIEVWHLHDEQPDANIKQELEKLDAHARDLSNLDLIQPITKRRDAEKQFQIKAAAIINSAFEQVLYLDSDNVPVQDPTFLFDTPEYQNSGALFWPDFWKTHGENKIFDILDIECQDDWEQESGQMVIHKQKSWLPLQLAWYMQKHSDIYFQFLNGDKDTFKYAWKALDMPYHMVEAFVGMGGTMSGTRFCGHTMLQYMPASAESEEEDEPVLLFVHSNLLKITDKVHFIHNGQPEHPWDLAKRSTLSHSNTWIKPEFYVSPRGEACMDFTHREGEPDAITQNFDAVVPGFQANYFKYGGIGGETRA